MTRGCLACAASDRSSATKAARKVRIWERSRSTRVATSIFAYTVALGLVVPRESARRTVLALQVVGRHFSRATEPANLGTAVCLASRGTDKVGHLFGVDSTDGSLSFEQSLEPTEPESPFCFFVFFALGIWEKRIFWSLLNKIETRSSPRNQPSFSPPSPPSPSPSSSSSSSSGGSTKGAAAGSGPYPTTILTPGPSSASMTGAKAH